MLVLEAKVGTPVYAADFGRVEAKVSLLVKTHQGQLPHWIHLRTSQPLHGSAPLERRLIEDATRLARMLKPGNKARSVLRAA